MVKNGACLCWYDRPSDRQFIALGASYLADKDTEPRAFYRLFLPLVRLASPL